MEKMRMWPEVQETEVCACVQKVFGSKEEVMTTEEKK